MRVVSMLVATTALVASLVGCGVSPVAAPSAVSGSKVAAKSLTANLQVIKQTVESASMDQDEVEFHAFKSVTVDAKPTGTVFHFKAVIEGHLVGDEAPGYREFTYVGSYDASTGKATCKMAE
jgi:hypothetical protein